MPAITPEMIEATYAAARSVYAKTTTKKDAVNEVVQNADMNPSSANIFITTAVNLISNEYYTRTVNGEATEYFLVRIRKEYGFVTYKKALARVRENVEHNSNPQNNIKQRVLTS